MKQQSSKDAKLFDRFEIGNTVQLNLALKKLLRSTTSRQGDIKNIRIVKDKIKIIILKKYLLISSELILTLENKILFKIICFGLEWDNISFIENFVKR